MSWCIDTCVHDSIPSLQSYVLWDCTCRGQDDGGAAPAARQAAAARALGLPDAYDTRFRINASLVHNPEALRAAERAIDRRLGQLAGQQRGQRGWADDNTGQLTGAEVSAGGRRRSRNHGQHQ